MKTVNDIRESFLKFFESKAHSRISSSSLVPHNDPTLMFANAGMNQFKNVFNGVEIWKDAEGNPVYRATSSQKCVRAGGKHNDLDNVGYTARHHTFFEMLGNFSFGDYFKQEAIEYAWEFLTSKEWMGIAPEKLYVTIYHTDDEAFDIWKKVTGFPDEKIIRISTKDNFWEMGDTGPCGPCSEIFYDHGDKYEGGLPGTPEEDGDRYIEIWNLVFMQYEKLPDGSQVDLPKPCIDTGMGLERMAALMQGKNNNYETDLFEHLIKASKKIVNASSCGTQGVSTGSMDSAQSKLSQNDINLLTSHRVIADHLRCSCFLLADGVMPSNEGRGYVLRRIMRRGMRHAHILGCTEPLMYKLVPALLKEMGSAFPELERAKALIVETLKLEEEKFKETLERGLKLLEEEITGLKKGDVLKGEVAFKLYDTYGFPLDLTQDILRGHALTVDIAGFDEAMAEQKAKARAAHAGSGDVAVDAIWFEIEQQHGATEFLGYGQTTAQGRIIAIVKDGQLVDKVLGGEAMILTNQTPFYAESGGQAGDKGTLSSSAVEIEVTDTKKQIGKLHVHLAKISKGEVKVGDDLNMEVDVARRDSLRANHSATHILHAALRHHLGDHVTQKGSLVEAGYFRFDFSHPKAVTKDEIIKIEEEVKQVIAQKSDVETKLMTPDEAIKSGAMALFGEKYGDEVRVLSMGKGLDSDGSYSVELCGGTHVRNTSDIGDFKIIKETSVAAGVRRIEAKTGEAVSEYLAEQAKVQAEEEQRKKAAEQAKAEQAKAVSGAADDFIQGIESAQNINGNKFYGIASEGVSSKDLRGLVDEFKKRVDKGVVVIIAINDGKVGIVVGVSDNLTDKVSAVDLVRKGSEILGGKGGGGRPDFAQSGGVDAEKAQHAIEAIKEMVGSI